MSDGTFSTIYGKKKTRKVSSRSQNFITYVVQEMIREQKALRRKQEKEEKKALKAEQVKKLSVQVEKKSP